MPKLTGNRCQCPTCGEYFTSARSFDRHRIGDYGTNRRCMTPAEMDAAGFDRNARGFRGEPGRHRKPTHSGLAARRTGEAMHLPHPATGVPETRVTP